MKRYWFFALLLSGILTGCARMTPDIYKQETPELKVEEYFLGKTLGWGMFQDRFGKVRNRFRVVMNGRVEGSELILDEDFYYQDGSTSNRLWTLQVLENGRYVGEAADVLGTASGSRGGNSFNWRYEMNLPVGGRKWRVAFDDWLYLQDNGVVINVATVSKWGIRLGTLTFMFAKQEQMAQAFAQGVAHE